MKDLWNLIWLIAIVVGTTDILVAIAKRQEKKRRR